MESLFQEEPHFWLSSNKTTRPKPHLHGHPRKFLQQSALKSHTSHFKLYYQKFFKFNLVFWHKHQTCYFRTMKNRIYSYGNSKIYHIHYYLIYLEYYFENIHKFSQEFVQHTACSYIEHSLICFKSLISLLSARDSLFFSNTETNLLHRHYVLSVKMFIK